jgi:hypothetical protein
MPACASLATHHDVVTAALVAVVVSLGLLWLALGCVHQLKPRLGMASAVD